MFLIFYSFLLQFYLSNILFIFSSKIDLGGNVWNFYSSSLNISGVAYVPGDIYADLEANNFIKNPFYGQGDSLYKWIGQQDWIYEREIILPKKVYKVSFFLNLFLKNIFV
jgi:beta-galactosidase/beta-glucuronidase